MAANPRAKGGLITAKHAKDGRHFVTAFDPESMQVSLLDPWEHAILVLCDGTRDANEITQKLSAGVGNRRVSRGDVKDALVRFEAARLMETSERAVGLSPSPRTLAHLQQAYREWHKDPAKTGKILAGEGTPFVDVTNFSPGLDPTVALPDDRKSGERTSVAVGTTLVLGDSEAAFAGSSGSSLTSLLGEPKGSERVPTDPARPAPDDRRPAHCPVDAPPEDGELENVSELLKAVDYEFAWLEDHERPPVHRVPNEKKGSKAIPPAPMPALDSASVLALPVDELDKRDVEVVGLPNADASLIEAPPTVRSRKLSEASLTPTLVGVPADDGGVEPVFLAPPRVSEDPEVDSSERRKPPDPAEVRPRKKAQEGDG